jgi:hypothetical protein
MRGRRFTAGLLRGLLAALAAIDRGYGADFLHVVQDGAPGDPRSRCFPRSANLTLIDELLQASRRDAQGADGLVKGELHVHGHSEEIITRGGPSK